MERHTARPGRLEVGRRRRVGVAGVVALATLALVTAACGGGSSASSGSKGLVTAPSFTLQGCTFAPNDSIPPGYPKGLQPNFAAFSPDPSADAAIRSISHNGGTAVVDSAGVPGGATLYAGPDRSGAVIGTVPAGQDILLAEPLLWHEGGDTWMAFFLECGGPNLYWASLENIKSVSPTTATDLSGLFAELQNAPPYTQTHQASLLPVEVKDGHLVWKDSSVPFDVGRGQLIQHLG